MGGRYYVTVQLTNGGIESLEIELAEDLPATHDVFQDYIEQYDSSNMPYYLSGLWSKGHIIAWSKIE